MTDTAAPVHAHTGAHPSLEVLTRKYGPLPGWAWAALAVGGYLAYRWYQNRNATNTLTTGATTSPANSGKGPGFRGPGNRHTYRYPKPPVTKITYTTQQNDTLGSIALRFYGTDQFWTDIRHHNQGKVGTKSKGAKLRPGITLVIPQNHPIR